MYRKLKQITFSDDITQAMLAKVIKKSEKYVSTRMTGKMPFDMAEVYAICDYLHIPYERIPEYFPPGGDDLAYERYLATRPKAQTRKEKYA